MIAETWQASITRRLALAAAARLTPNTLRGKLIGATLLTSAAALLLTAALVIASNVLETRSRLVQESQTLADLVGRAATAALLFFDRKTATDDLAILQAKSNIRRALILDAAGNPFAVYPDRRQAANSESAAMRVQAQAQARRLLDAYRATDDRVPRYDHRFEGDDLLVLRPIEFESDIIGSVFLQWDISADIAHQIDNLLIVSAIALTALLLAAVLAYKLLKFFTAPISELLSGMRQVSETGSYSLRIESAGADELGQLTDGFNDMLRQVERRDRELSRYRDHLEDQVVERTEQLVEARDKALAASAAKSVFVANMSHEIRTPLNAILGYAQVLGSGKLRPQQKEYLQVIQDGGEHLLGLINEILDFSSIEAGVLTLNEAGFDLEQMIAQLDAMFQLRCRNKGIGWRVDSTLAGPVAVHGDAGKLRQVLINILGNAVKFTDRGEVTLSVSQSAENDYRFTIADTGPGIATEQQAEVFEPFRQLPTGGTPRRGTGLGLSISKRYVEWLGGELELCSTVGLGSRFSFAIQLPPTLEPIIVASASDELPKLCAKHHYRALVVDDVCENRELLLTWLEGMGFMASSAADGQQAIDAARHDRPDVVLMDIRMPVMGGLEAVKQLRMRYGAAIKYVAVSASTMDHEANAYATAGFDAFVAKPVLLDELVNCLREQLGDIFRDSSAVAEIRNTISEADWQQLQLPEALAARLSEAAALGQLSELYELVDEVSNLGIPSAERFAEELRRSLDRVDFVAIENLLSKAKNAV